MRLLRMVAIGLLIATSGCASLDERYATSNVRHPCGNVWDVCPGDSVIIDRINKTLGGAQ